MKSFLDECDYLIHLVRCAIHHLQPQELPENLSFELVYDWGRYHHIANIAFYSVERLNNKPEPALYHKWQICRNQAVIREINQSYAAQEIRDALQLAGIRYLEVQGTKIKPLYPQPDFRTMSDIDFVVDPENLSKARTVLENLGYQCGDSQPEDVECHRPPNINVEIHTEFFGDDSQYFQVMAPPFAETDEDGQCEENAFYLYNILHIAKHYFHGGCGIRRVLDVYYLNKVYGRSLQRPPVREGLERAGTVDFATELETLADVWFGEDEHNLPRSQMARYIMGSGLHGNSINAQKNSLKKDFDNTVPFAKLKYLLRRLFGTKQDLRTRYPVLERYPMLYPFFRFCRVLQALNPKQIRKLKAEVKIVLEIEPTELERAKSQENNTGS